MSGSPFTTQQSLANEIESKINSFFRKCVTVRNTTNNDIDDQSNNPNQQQQQQEDNHHHYHQPSSSSSYTFKQAKQDIEVISALLNKLELALDQTQTIFAVDHNKSHMMRQEMLDKSKMSASDHLSHILKTEVLEKTAQDKKSLAQMSQSTLIAMDHLKRLNDPLFLDFIQEQEQQSQASQSLLLHGTININMSHNEQS